MADLDFRTFHTEYFTEYFPATLLHLFPKLIRKADDILPRWRTAVTAFPGEWRLRARLAFFVGGLKTRSPTLKSGRPRLPVNGKAIAQPENVNAINSDSSLAGRVG